MAQIESATASKRESRMLGLGLDAWNNIVVAALAFGAVAAIVIGVATYAVVRLQKADAEAAAVEFERYKLATEKTISEANARAEEAKLETERLKKEVAWRELPPGIAAKLVAELSKEPGEIAIVWLVGDPESAEYSSHFANVFRNAGWQIEIVGRTFLGPPEGLYVEHGKLWNPSIDEAVKRLRKTLGDAGIAIQPGNAPVEANVPQLMLGNDTSNIRLVVGVKPAPKIR